MSTDWWKSNLTDANDHCVICLQRFSAWIIACQWRNTTQKSLKELLIHNMESYPLCLHTLPFTIKQVGCMINMHSLYGESILLLNQHCHSPAILMFVTYGASIMRHISCSKWCYLQKVMFKLTAVTIFVHFGFHWASNGVLGSDLL